MAMLPPPQLPPEILEHIQDSIPDLQDRGSLRLISAQFSRESRRQAHLENDFAIFRYAIDSGDIDRLRLIHSMFPRKRFPDTIPKMLTSYNGEALVISAHRGDLAVLSLIHEWAMEFNMNFSEDLLAINKYAALTTAAIRGGNLQILSQLYDWMSPTHRDQMIKRDSHKIFADVAFIGSMDTFSCMLGWIETSVDKQEMMRSQTYRIFKSAIYSKNTVLVQALFNGDPATRFPLATNDDRLSMIRYNFFTFNDILLSNDVDMVDLLWRLAGQASQQLQTELLQSNFITAFVQSAKQDHPEMLLWLLMHGAPDQMKSSMRMICSDFWFYDQQELSPRVKVLLFEWAEEEDKKNFKLR